MSDDTTKHFDQTPRRSADFINPPNYVKEKVGSGGLSEQILLKAQQILEENRIDFAPIAEMYLHSLTLAVEKARHISGTEGDHEMTISSMIYPTMQLKANGGMFHFPLVTLLADKQVQFLEVIATIDDDVIELLLAFMATIRAVLASQIKDVKHIKGQELLFALDSACRRYFTKHEENRNPA